MDLMRKRIGYKISVKQHAIAFESIDKTINLIVGLINLYQSAAVLYWYFNE